MDGGSDDGSVEFYKKIKLNFLRRKPREEVQQ